MSYVPTGKQIKIPWAMKSIDKYREGFDRIFGKKAEDAEPFHMVACSVCGVACLPYDSVPIPCESCTQKQEKSECRAETGIEPRLADFLDAVNENYTGLQQIGPKAETRALTDAEIERRNAIRKGFTLTAKLPGGL